MIYVIIYLSSIVAANLSVALFGPGVSIINAFLFIGLDLTTRDKLHDLWNKKNLWIKMVVLIFSGSALSWMLNKDAGQIAAASFVSFLVAGLIDSVIYQLTKNKPKLYRINASNTGGALADSILFPWIAFGGFMWFITLGQFIAKTLGGFIWALILNWLENKRGSDHE